MGKKVLSVLIATVESRVELFDKLYDHLLNVAPDNVEILSLRDNKEISIGAKRQRLLEMAKGDYVVFIDDDDWVPDHYFAEIVKAIGYEKDSIGFLINCSINGVPRSAIASFRYKTWESGVDGYDYVRSIYHKTPVRRDLALQAGFRDMRFGEDADYAKRLMPLVQNEYFINRTMYHYRYSSKEQFNQKYGIR